MPSKIAVVCEARADFQTATGFADRIIVDEVDWISADGIDDYRLWQGPDDSSPFLRWRDVNKLAKLHNLRLQGILIQGMRKVNRGRKMPELLVGLYT